jgi:hypothetical protein
MLFSPGKDTPAVEAPPMAAPPDVCDHVALEFHNAGVPTVPAIL